jgi:hypothetical protein
MNSTDYLNSLKKKSLQESTLEILSNPEPFQNFPFQKQDSNFFQSLISESPELFNFLPKHAKLDKNIRKNFILKNPKNLELLSREIIQDEKFFFLFYLENKEMLGYLPYEWKNSKSIFKTILRSNGRYLMYASDEIKNNKELVIIAIKDVAHAYRYASEALKRDLEIILICISRVTMYLFTNTYGNPLKVIPEEFRFDPQIAKKILHKGSIRAKANYLEYFIGKTNDYELLKEMVKSMNCYHKLPRLLKNDKELTILAVKHSVKTFTMNVDVSKYKDDPDFFLQIIPSHPEILLKAISRNFSFCQDKEFIKKAIQTNIRTMNLFSLKDEDYWEIAKTNASVLISPGIPFFETNGRRWVDDREFVLTALRCTYASKKLTFENISHFLNDKEIVLEAIRNHNLHIKILQTLKDDREVILEAVKLSKDQMGYISNKFHQDRDFIMECLRYQPFGLFYCSEKFKNDKEIVLECVKRKGKSLKHASLELKMDKEIIFHALRESVSSFKWIHSSLKSDIEVQWKSKKYFKLIQFIPLHNLVFKFK